MIKVLILQNQILHYRKPLFNQLSKKFEVIVLHSGKKSLNDEEENFYREIILPCTSLAGLHFQKELFLKIRQENPDVIIVMFDLHWISYILLSIFQQKKPIVLWGHRYSKNNVVNLLKNRILKKSDAIILYGSEELSAIIKNKVDASKIFIAFNTIDVPNHADTSQSEKNTFLYVGRAQKRKKIDLLLYSFARILYQLPESIKIDIVGDGEENLFLASLAEKLCISSRVNFVGEITNHTELKKYFSRAFAYVSPGPVGLGVLHSFAYGVPVVTCKSGKHGPEFYNLEHNKNALIYERDSELDGFIISLAKNSSLSQSLGNNAYLKYKDKLTIEKMVAAFDEAIHYSLRISKPKSEQ